MTDELLALLVEVTSVGASGQQLREPLDLPRPHDRPGSQGRPSTTEERDQAFKKGVAVLASTSRQVNR